MEKIIKFHENCLMMIIFVLILVFALLFYNIMNLNSSILNLEKMKFEILWTLIPSFLIICLMIPSLELLYFSESSGKMNVSKKMKVMGHQWYWSYEEKNSLNKKIIKFDSYIMKDQNLNFGDFRKCEVDCPIIFESGCSTRLLVTSSDSIHSWAIPEFGVKVDAVPGRLNQVIIFTKEVGRFFGFCSELCGVNHSFMPIVAEVMNLESLIDL